MTLRAARAFFDTEGIAISQQEPGVLHVAAEELERAAADAAERARKQRMRQGLALYLGVIASGLAATSIVPRMLASAGL